MLQRIKDIYSYKDMIYSLVRRELRGRYKGSVLGFLWTYINPLCQIIVYSAVFSVIFRVQIEKFYLYLTIGMMPWVFFNTSVQGGSTCIRAQADMVKNIFSQRSDSHFLCHQCLCQHAPEFYYCFSSCSHSRMGVQCSGASVSAADYGD